MAAPPHPHAEDVIIRQESPAAFTIGVSSGAPQIVCTTLEEALQRAAGFASKEQVRLWYTEDGQTCAQLADDKLLRTIWNEYVEMPGLRLTREQAQRLWAMDADTCTSVLESLITLKFLVCCPDGKYARPTEATDVGPLRMARAEIHVRRVAGSRR
jgi:hypothetical protein